MTSTLCIRKTPEPQPESSTMAFGHPFKAMVARRFYDHDGSLGGRLRTISTDELPWFQGIRDAGVLSPADHRQVLNIIGILQEGGTIDMWFEV